MHRYCCLLWILSWSAFAAGGVAADGVENAYMTRLPYAIEIDKSDRRLRVTANGTTYLEFQIASGRGGPGPKAQIGDKRTPVGIYRIVGFNESSRFHYFMRLNYPNVKDAFYGLKNGVISKAEFDHIVTSLKGGGLPPQNTGLGGAIGIHGLGEETSKSLRIHENVDWTEGCVALRNDEVARLRDYVGIGTEVVIRE